MKSEEIKANISKMIMDNEIETAIHPPEHETSSKRPKDSCSRFVSCRFCGQKPDWKFYTERHHKYWTGHAEHFCEGQEYYLHGVDWAVTEDWNKLNAEQ